MDEQESKERIRTLEKQNGLLKEHIQQMAQVAHMAHQSDDWRVWPRKAMAEVPCWLACENHTCKSSAFILAEAS